MFWLKMSYIDTGNDKNLKISNFYGFYAFFSKFLMNVMDWNAKTGQQGRNVLSSRLLRRVNCSFLVKKLQIDTEIDKKPKTFQFSKVFCNFC